MQKSPEGFWFGMIFVLMGSAMMVAMALNQDGLNVPLWVAEAAGACFVFAGASVIARSFALERLSHAFSLLVVYMLFLPGFWIGFFSDGNGCSVSTTVGGLTFSGDVASSGDWGCRIAFGTGSLITLACALGFTWMLFRRPVRKTEPAPNGPTKASS